MSSRVKELMKQFDKGTPAKKIVDKSLPPQSGSYLYGGKTVEAQQNSTPLVVIARPGAYNMVCNEDACYIRVPHTEGAAASTQISTNPAPPSYYGNDYSDRDRDRERNRDRGSLSSLSSKQQQLQQQQQQRYTGPTW